MSTQPDGQPTTPDPEIEGSQSADLDAGGIGPGALATVGLGLIALAILLWFLYPRFGNGSQPATGQAPATIVAGLVTATPVPATDTPIAAEPVTEAATSVPAPSTATTVPSTATLPSKVQEGTYAKVAGTGSFGLRFRSGPGGDYVTWRILTEGETVKVTGGPRETGDAVWWRVVDNTGLVGWAAEQFLVPVEPPGWTPEPERTPDLTETAPTSEP